MTPEVRPVGWGILGARSWIAGRAVLPALAASATSTVVALASRSGPPPRQWGGVAMACYDDVLTHPDVEAVYVPLPNDQHRRWVEAAAAAGRHVLCEKPLATSAAEATAMFAACDSAGVLLAEAYMTPFHPRSAALDALVGGGTLGTFQHGVANFTFPLDPGATGNYRWSGPAGGGALADVGIYCVAPLLRAAGRAPFVVRAAARRLGGIDVATSAWLDFGDGATASMFVGFDAAERQHLSLTYGLATVVVEDQPFTPGPRNGTFLRQDREGAGDRVEVTGEDPYRLMVDAFSAAVSGRGAWPRPRADVLAVADVIDRISEAGTRAAGP